MTNDTSKYIQGLFEEYAGYTEKYGRNSEDLSSEQMAQEAYNRSFALGWRVGWNQGWKDALGTVKLRLIQLEKEEKTK